MHHLPRASDLLRKHLIAFPTDKLNFRPISLHSIFEFWISEFISNLEKNRVQNQLDFFSSLNLISTACVACKNQFRNQIDFSVF